MFCVMWTVRNKKKIESCGDEDESQYCVAPFIHTRKKGRACDGGLAEQNDVVSFSPNPG